MNVLFPYLARWRSANWSRYHQLLGALCRQGHRVHVLEAPMWHGAAETNYTDAAVVPLPAGMAVHEIPVPLWRARLPLEKLAKKGLLTLATRRYVAEMVRAFDIDVLLLYNFPQCILAPAAGGRCKVVFDVADDLLSMFATEAGRWRPLLYPIARRAFDSLVRRSDLVITCSTTLAARLPGAACVVPNGADLEAAAAADGRAIRGQYPTPIVGFVGAFEYVVDFDLVLDAAAMLPEATFLLVGTGRRWEEVRRQAGDRGLTNVVLPGPVPYPRNLDYVDAMDVCLLPRVPGPVADGAAPLKLFEYLALGKPVVATPMKEVELIAGDLVTVAHNGAQAAARIREILDRPEAWRARVEAGRARVQSTYNWDRIARDLAALLVSGR